MLNHVKQCNLSLVIDEIEQKKIDINAVLDGDAKDHMVHIAAYYNTTEDIMKVLVTHDANINLVNGNGVNALAYSIIMGNGKVTSYLLSLPNLLLNNRDCNNGTIMHHCIRYLRYDVLHHLLKTFKDIDLEVKHSVEGSVLEYACSLGKEDLVKALIKAGSNINVMDKDNKFLIIKCIEMKRYGVARILIDSKCIINCFCPMGNTPLYYAVLDGNIDISTLLLRNAANPRARSRERPLPPS